jgi:hypothetical protein
MSVPIAEVVARMSGAISPRASCDGCPAAGITSLRSRLTQDIPDRLHPVLSRRVRSPMIRRHSSTFLTRTGHSCPAFAVVAALAILVLSVGLAPDLGVWGLTVPIMPFTISFGLVSPALQTTALEHHGLRAGTAASLLGAADMT